MRDFRQGDKYQGSEVEMCPEYRQNTRDASDHKCQQHPKGPCRLLLLYNMN